MNLFQSGEFALHSGDKSTWKIDCDALTPEDMETLADIAVQMLPPFSRALGVPTGGEAFAAALNARSSEDGPTLIVDDVLTTGKSMEDYRMIFSEPTIGIVIFARGAAPSWVMPLFWMMDPSWADLNG